MVVSLQNPKKFGNGMKNRKNSAMAATGKIHPKGRTVRKFIPVEQR